MKKTILILSVLLFSLPLFADEASDVWTCSSAADCSDGMDCGNENTCVMNKSKFTDYIAITLFIGENSPNTRGTGSAKRIFIQNPANDLVLGQVDVSASGGQDGKLYIIKDMTADITIYPSSKISCENFRLIYDKNGNGNADPGEPTVSEGSFENNTVKYRFNQKEASYPVNAKSNFLMIASCAANDAVTDENTKISATVRDSYITAVGTGGNATLAQIQPLTFPTYTFEPESGYFLFTAGRFFPKAPSWSEMNKTQEIMHIRAKAIDSANEIKTVGVALNGTAVSFGNGVESIALYLDSNNDGKGDKLISEITEFPEPFQTANLIIPAGSLQFTQGEEKHLVISATLNFYNGQTTYFYIGKTNVVLTTNKQVAGPTIQTDTFTYKCDETEPNCNLKPDENNDNESSGCALVFVE